MSSILDQERTSPVHVASHRPASRFAMSRMPITLAPQWRWRALLGVMTGVAFFSFIYRNKQSYDLFIDEPFYAQVGQSVAHGQLPYAAGVHFFLHPPGYFYVEALWMRIFGLHNEVFAQVYSLRNLVAVFAALSVLMVALIVDRVAGRRAALLAAFIFMANAFVHRDSGINILEPSTIFWALAGYAVLVHLRPSDRRHRALRIVAAGLLFGMSILSKEFGLFITIVPMVFAFVFGCWLKRREALAVAGIAAVPYLIWVVVVAATGNWHTFVFQISTGFRRTAGTAQVTGFNAPTAPSFLDTLLKNVYYLWTAYAILGLGTLAILYLAWRPASALQRFIACYGLGAIPLLAYCVLIGTNEEQFFNFLLTPALICLVVVAVNLWPRRRTLVAGAVAVALAAVLISDIGNWFYFRSTTDNGTYRLDRWMAINVPIHTVVGVTNSVQREIFLRYTMVDDNGGDITATTDVQYIVVFYRQVNEGYAFITRPALDQQIADLPIAYEASDRSNGRMVVYRVVH